jgi:hypothetical protein
MSKKQNDSTTPATHGPRLTRQFLTRLRNLLVHLRIMDNHSGEPLTESLQQLQQGYMESQWPEITERGDRSILNDHFWMYYETAAYIDALPDAEAEKDYLIMTIDGLMLSSQLKEQEN